MVYQDDNVDERSQEKYKRNSVKHLSSQSVKQLKWDTDASRIDARHFYITDISCRVNK